MRSLLVLLSIAAALGFAAPIQADPTGDPRLDANFLDALQRAGVVFNNGASAVNAAKVACAMMNQGQPEIGVIHSVTEQNPACGMMSWDHPVLLNLSTLQPSLRRGLAAGNPFAKAFRGIRKL